MNKRLLLNLYVLRGKLDAIMKSNLKYANKLAIYLLDNPNSTATRPKGFNGRFARYFDNINMLKATAIHPRYKFTAVKKLNETLYQRIRSELVQEMDDQIGSNFFKGNDDFDESEDEFLEVFELFPIG